MSEFDPNGPGAPRIEYAIVDEQLQMQQYLADIAMADLEMLPPESNRRVRPGSLLAQYKAMAAERHAAETIESVTGVAEEILQSSPEGPRLEKHSVGEFVGRKE